MYNWNHLTADGDALATTSKDVVDKVLRIITVLSAAAASEKQM